MAAGLINGRLVSTYSISWQIYFLTPSDLSYFYLSVSVQGFWAVLFGSYPGVSAGEQYMKGL
jgi:hypothetical protein